MAKHVLKQGGRSQLVPPWLSNLDRTLSLQLYRNVGLRIPRAVFMLLEHSGSGLLWLPLAPLLWMAPGAGPQARR